MTVAFLSVKTVGLYIRRLIRLFHGSGGAEEKKEKGMQQEQVLTEPSVVRRVLGAAYR